MMPMSCWQVPAVSILGEYGCPSSHMTMWSDPSTVYIRRTLIILAPCASPVCEGLGSFVVCVLHQIDFSFIVIIGLWKDSRVCTKGTKLRVGDGDVIQILRMGGECNTKCELSQTLALFPLACNSHSPLILFVVGPDAVTFVFLPFAQSQSLVMLCLFIGKLLESLSKNLFFPLVLDCVSKLL